MAGEVDAIDMKAGAAGDFHVHHRQRDGNAGAPLDDLVQETVARIVVSLAISGEAFLVKQVCVQHIDGCFRLPEILQAVARHEAFARSRPHRIELLEIRRRIERRAFELRDHQRRRCQVVIGACRQLREFRDERVFHRARPLSRIISSTFARVRSLSRSTMRSARPSSDAGYVCVTATHRRPALPAASSPQ